LAEGSEPWAIPWPCLYEFLAVVTHPKIFQVPTPLRDAVDQVEAWLESPSVALLAEGRGFWGSLSQQLLTSGVAGPVVHDARVATLCLAHGISELWSADRDFGRFPGLRVRNPLVGWEWRFFKSRSDLESALSFVEICKASDARGNLITAAHLAALAVEAGSDLITTDRDFARFRGLSWRHSLDWVPARISAAAASTYRNRK
jgi:uncharacterized protein